MRSGDSDPMVAVQGLSRTYGSGPGTVHALREVSFEVAPGEMVAVVGRSGSGKTTLLNMLGGLDRPDEGTVHVDGLDVTGLDDAGLSRLRRDSVAYVFQTFGLIPALTAAENVGVPLRLRRTPVAERERRVELLLDLVGLAGHARQRPTELSGGQQQRVAIARAMVTRPDVLFADEPTGALDSSAARVVLDLMRQMADAGQSIVMVTHDPAAAARANAVIFLRDGRVVDRLAGAGPREVADRLAGWEAAR